MLLQVCTSVVQLPNKQVHVNLFPINQIFQGTGEEM